MQKHLAFFSPAFTSLIRPTNPIITQLFSTSVSSLPDFLPSYLVTKCGFSPEKTSKAFDRLSRQVRSQDQPDSVIAFFKSHGFNDSHLRKILSSNPQLLAVRVEKTLAPKFHALQELGFTGDDITQIVCSCPIILSRSVENHIVPVMNLCIRLFGSHTLLMKCLKRTPCHFHIIKNSIDKTLGNISLLHDLGLSDSQIGTIIRHNPFIVIQKPESLNKLVSRVERLGLPRGSPNFHWALFALSKVSEDNERTKVELWKGFGWSEDDFSKAFRKAPLFFTSSVKMLEEKIEFLLKEAGCAASYIALSPVLLTLSLDKRLIPRVKILKALKEKGLSGGDRKLGTTMTFTNNKFFERYVAPHEKEIPELIQFFNASS